MIPNVTRGGKTAGVLRHLVGKGKREEHERPHLVAGSPEAVRLAGDPELAGRDARELARARAQCRWVAIRHGRSTGGSDHAHLVVMLVAEDGSKASVHNDRRRAQAACRELEQRFGLRALETRTRGAASRALKHGEIAADRRLGRGAGESGPWLGYFWSRSSF